MPPHLQASPIRRSATPRTIKGSSTNTLTGSARSKVPVINIFEAIDDGATTSDEQDHRLDMPQMSYENFDEATSDDGSDTEGEFGDENSQNEFLVAQSADGTSEDEDEDEDDEVEEGNEWEDQSLYEELLDGQASDEPPSSQDGLEYCTALECKNYKAFLRKVGPRAFIDRTVSNGSITAKKLITAFAIRPPSFLEGSPDHVYLTLLGIAIQREMSRRLKLDHINTIPDVVSLLQKSQNVMVLTGAGISTSLGIPDFRSKDNGLYSMIGDLGLGDPQEVFNLEVFQDDPTYFYSVAKHILPSTRRFSPTHAFIELLQRKGKLLRNYTQNIDNIEQYAGIRPEKLVQCHGSFATASCMKCKVQVPCSKIYDDLKAGRVARCEKCMEVSTEQKALDSKKRKRPVTKSKSRKNKFSEDSSAEEEEFSLDKDVEVMKPDIIFFGEQLPERFHRIVDHDRAKVDLLICIGTSLKVAPVSDLTAFIPPTVPQIYISREPCTHIEFDVELLGMQCDDICVELARMVGWKDDLVHQMIPQDLEMRIEGVEGRTSQFFMNRVMPPPPSAASTVMQQ